MESIVRGTARPRQVGQGDDSNIERRFERDETADHFDGIDWSVAAPSWGSMFAGLVLPILALVVPVILIDVALVWLIERSINHSWSGASWVLSVIMFPIVLACAFPCVKFYHYLNHRRRRR
jgi:hypothetical protein